MPGSADLRISEMARVTIQYWAAAKEAAGVAAESVEAETLAEALDAIVARRGDDAATERLRSVLAASSFLVDGAPAGRRGTADLILQEAARIGGVRPFAGGLLVGGGHSPGCTAAGWITPYSGKASTFRSQTPSGVSMSHVPPSRPELPGDR